MNERLLKHHDGANVSGLTEAIGRPWDDGHPDPLIAQSKRFGDLLHALSGLPQVLIAAVAFTAKRPPRWSR